MTLAASALTMIGYGWDLAAVALTTMIPYYPMIEVYLRYVKPLRRERETTARLLSTIGDTVKHSVTGTWPRLLGLLDSWRRLLWALNLCNRAQWASGLFMLFGSQALVGYLGYKRIPSGITVGGLTAILSLTGTMHSAMVNALWGLCMLGQALPAIERVMPHMGREKA